VGSLSVNRIQRKPRHRYVDNLHFHPISTHKLFSNSAHVIHLVMLGVTICFID